jgi:hypothetical protein
LSKHGVVLDASSGKVTGSGEGITAVPVGSDSISVHPDPFVQVPGPAHMTPTVQSAPLQNAVAGTPTDPGAIASGTASTKESTSAVLLKSTAQLKSMVRCKPVAYLCMVRCTDNNAPVQQVTIEHVELEMTQVDIGDGSVPAAELQQYSDGFQPVPPGAVSTAGLVHTIPLLPDAQPINQRPYRTPQALLPELEKQIADLLAKGWIRPSSSPWGSPVLFVPKKDNT